MRKRTLVIPALLALIITGFPSAVLGAGVRGGFFAAAAPVYLVPASADFYVELNRAGVLGDNLAALVKAYRRRPATAAAITQLTNAIGPAAIRQFNTLLAAAPARVGAFVSIPTNSSAQPQVAVIAQLRPASYANGGNPLSGVASFSPATSYRGTSIYHVTFTGGFGSAYGAIVSGDGVIAGDVATVRGVIDTAAFTPNAPSLASNRDFDTALAQEQATYPVPTRTLTFYVSRPFLLRTLQAARQSSGSAAAITPATARFFQRAYALGVTALPDGILSVSSAVPASGPLAITPNNGASVVGNNAILYTSIQNLYEMLTAARVLPPNSLNQLKVQTGIDIAGDVAPLISREVVVDVNDETSPLLVLGLAGAGSSAAMSIPSLPGSLELASEVSDQGSAQMHIDHLVNAVTHLAQQSGASLQGPLLRTVALPDGSTGHVVAALPSFGYSFRQVSDQFGRAHTFLVLSTNLPEDVRAASPSQRTLAFDPNYQTALNHISGAGSSASVQYVNISRLLSLVDSLLSYARSRGGVTSSSIAMYNQSIKPLIVPFQNVISVARVLGPRDAQAESFITVR